MVCNAAIGIRRASAFGSAARSAAMTCPIVASSS
jgi:hypothetical protein